MARRPKETLSPQAMWQLVHEASDELAAELGLESPPAPFSPERALRAVDDWLAGQEGALDEGETTRLGALLCRVLLETHGGGLTLIEEPGHALDGEWAVSDFESGLERDFHVPFVVSAALIGLDRALSATAWYAQLLREGRPVRRR